jgi:uncharacterized protein YecE (DUF72 family)
VYVYFDNDEAGCAVHNAATLRELVEGRRGREPAV